MLQTARKGWLCYREQQPSSLLVFLKELGQETGVKQAVDSKVYLQSKYAPSTERVDPRVGSTLAL